VFLKSLDLEGMFFFPGSHYTAKGYSVVADSVLKHLQAPFSTEPKIN